MIWPATPSVLLIDFFSFLRVNDRCRVASVCKSWNVAEENGLLWKTLDLSKHFPTLQLYGEDEWKKVFVGANLSFEGLHALNKRVCVALYRVLQYPQIQKEGGSLITIPARLTLNAFLKLAVLPVGVKPDLIHSYCYLVRGACGDTVVEKTRRVFISRASFESISFIEKEPLCKQAELRHVLVHMLFAYCSTDAGKEPVSLYKGDYIQCDDSLGNVYQPLVEAWLPEGFINIQDTWCIRTKQARYVVQMEC